MKTHYSYCVHTGHSTNTNPWWRVDLGRVEPVAEVRILNRDCGSCGTALDGAKIRVGKLQINFIAIRRQLWQLLLIWTTCLTH